MQTQEDEKNERQLQSVLRYTQMYLILAVFTLRRFYHPKQ